MGEHAAAHAKDIVIINRTINQWEEVEESPIVANSDEWNEYFFWSDSYRNASNHNNNDVILYDDDDGGGGTHVVGSYVNHTNYTLNTSNIKSKFNTKETNDDDGYGTDLNNYWALLALILVFGTAAGNILVCLAIGWERRLQNVTNYFLMSLAITDLMVAILVMPLGILTLVKGYFPLGSEHCLTWICLDVLFCTASIMHLCTISVDRYLSLRYPMRFGRNKTRRRVTLKIIFVWLLSIAMSLPLSLMYSKDHASVLVNGTCQIPDPVYKLVGSIVCFYIPLGVMLLTYCLTVRLLARQRQNIGGANDSGTPGWASGWFGQTPMLERRSTWRRLLKPTLNATFSSASHAHSGNSTDTEFSTMDTHELWLPDSSIPEPTMTTMTALHQFGAEMLKLSRGLESAASLVSTASITKSELSSTNYTQFLSSMRRHSQQNPHHTRFQYIPQQTSLNNPLQLKDHKKLQRLQPRTELISNLVKSPSTTQFPPNKLTPDRLKRKLSSLSLRERRNSTLTTDTCSNCNDDNNSMDLKATRSRKRFYSLPKDTVLVFYCSSAKKDKHEGAKEKDDSEDISTDKQTVQSEDLKKKITTQHHTDENYLQLPIICTCPYFGDQPQHHKSGKPTEVKIVSTTLKVTASSTVTTPNDNTESPITSLAALLVQETSTSTSSTTTTIQKHNQFPPSPPHHHPPSIGQIIQSNSSLYSLNVNSSESGTTHLLPSNIPKLGQRKLSVPKPTSMVTWDNRRQRRRGSSFGGVRTSILLTPTKGNDTSASASSSPLRRSATLRSQNNISNSVHKPTQSLTGLGNYHHHDHHESSVSSVSKFKTKTLQAPLYPLQRNQTIRSQHSRNSSVLSRNSSRHGRIIRLEQKATKVLGVVFFTFVILWSPFFVLNLLPSICETCESKIDHWVFDVVTWLGYASSMVNPIFYTIFNKVFRQAFKKVLMCQYSTTSKWDRNR